MIIFVLESCEKLATEFAEFDVELSCTITLLDLSNVMPASTFTPACVVFEIKFTPGAGRTVSITVAVALTCASAPEANARSPAIESRSDMFLIFFILSSSITLAKTMPKTREGKTTPRTVVTDRK